MIEEEEQQNPSFDHGSLPPPASRTKKRFAMPKSSPCSSADGYAKGIQRPHYTGITNDGNTCYLGSVLQCLAHCRCFSDYMLGVSTPPDSSSPGGSITPERNVICAIKGRLSALRAGVPEKEAPNASNALLELYEALLCGGGPEWRQFASVNPRSCFDELGVALPGWRLRSQNDAHEFCLILLDRLVRETGRELGGSRHSCRFASYPSASVLPIRTAIADAETRIYERAAVHWAQAVQKHYGSLVEQFYSQLVSQVLCRACGATYHNFEVMSTFPVCLPEDGERRVSLQSCLDGFFRDEALDGWKCDRCGKACAVKTYRFWKLPQVMLIVVKRTTEVGVKDERPVWPSQVLHMNRYSSGPLARKAYLDGQDRYSLKSAVCHVGRRMDSGHYFTVSNTDDNEANKYKNMDGSNSNLERDRNWRVYDDDDVTTCSSFPASKVYMLAYERCKKNEAGRSV